MLPIHIRGLFLSSQEVMEVKVVLVHVRRRLHARISKTRISRVSLILIGLRCGYVGTERMD